MIAVDTNILVYAHQKENSFQKKAEDVLKVLCENNNFWGIPYHCLIEFISIVTNPRIFKIPTPLGLAFEQIENLTGFTNLKILFDIDGQVSLLKKISINAKIKGREIHDARIVATCLENGIRVLYSADRDFSKYPHLKVINPLVNKKL